MARINLAYAEPLTGVPSVARLMRAPLLLRRDDAGRYVGPGEQGRVVQTSLQAFDRTRRATRFDIAAIEDLEFQLLQRLHRAGLLGVYIVVAPGDLRGGVDLRPRGDDTLHLVVHVAIVQALRVNVTGYKAHAGLLRAELLRASPIQPGPASLLRAATLQDYIDRLDARGARSVGVEVSPGTIPDAVILDYRVLRRRPWLVYAQLSNTGTTQTRRWIERFGLIDADLSGLGDALDLDYTTAGFDRVNALDAAYTVPLGVVARRSLRIEAVWQRYTASNVGLGILGFTGTTGGGGVALETELLRRRRLVVASVLGARLLHVSAANGLAGTSGSAWLRLPYVGVTLHRSNAQTRVRGRLTLTGGSTGASSAQRDALGRYAADAHWILLKGQAFARVDLDHWLAPRHAPGAPGNVLVLRAGVQDAFGRRLLPTEEAVLGGLGTVRGYAQSLVAGDDAQWGSIEYDLHPFRLGARKPRALRDLSVGAFVDGGHVTPNHPLSYERSAAMLGTGLALRASFASGLVLQADWGVALRAVGALASAGQPAARGSSAFNVVATWSF